MYLFEIIFRFNSIIFRNEYYYQILIQLVHFSVLTVMNRYHLQKIQNMCDNSDGIFLFIVSLFIMPVLARSHSIENMLRKRWWTSRFCSVFLTDNLTKMCAHTPGGKFPQGFLPGKCYSSCNCSLCCRTRWGICGIEYC